MYSQPACLDPNSMAIATILFVCGFNLFPACVFWQSPAQNISHKHFSCKIAVYTSDEKASALRARALNFYQISHKPAFQVHVAL